MLAKQVLLLCTLAASWNCGGEPEILVDVTGLPGGVERIRVRPSLDGTVDKDIFLNKDQTRFTVQLPASSEGTVQLDVAALNAVDCKLATGSVIEAVPGNLSHFVERTLELSVLPTPACVFADAINFAVVTNPLSVAVGDFNGDMKPDLAVTNANNVGILLGNGQGGFGQATNFAFSTPGTISRSVAVGDFNGDKKLDLAATHEIPSTMGVSTTISVLLGDGLGGFGAASNFTAGMFPRSVAVGDFNQDTKLDLAVANRDGNNVSVLLGDGLGRFGAPTNFAGGTQCYGVAVADFNSDQKLDLAVPNFGSSDVSILLANGLGSFGSAKNFAAGSQASAVVVGDFNGDQKLDLSVANRSKDNVSVLLGDGLGGFAGTRNFAAGDQPYAIIASDFNGDMHLDLAVANFASNDVSVLLGDGLGGFGLPTNFATGSQPTSLAFGDFNGDKKPDLIVVNFMAKNVSVLLNQF